MPVMVLMPDFNDFGLVEVVDSGNWVSMDVPEFGLIMKAAMTVVASEEGGVILDITPETFLISMCLGKAPYDVIFYLMHNRNSIEAPVCLSNTGMTSVVELTGGFASHEHSDVPGAGCVMGSGPLGEILGHSLLFVERLGMIPLISIPG